MSKERTTFSVRVDVSNPGQFFACCGLLELAHRLWPDAEGWFDDAGFNIRATSRAAPSLAGLIEILKGCTLTSDDPNTDDKICPIRMAKGIDMRIDWWLDKERASSRLKTWAGQQGGLKIALGMKDKLPQANEEVLNSATHAPAPYYFDSRRFAHALDAGFSLDEQQMDVQAYPAVELLALIGLQRFRPGTTEDRWSFAYQTWTKPLTPAPASAICAGAVAGHARYEYRVRFRDDQKRFKAFTRSTITQQLT